MISIAAIIATWVLSGLTSNSHLLSLALIIATTMVMVRLNTIHAIMRTYSRMVSCSFLAISAIALPYFINPTDAALPLCFSIIYTLLFFSYQDNSSVGIIFISFLILGVASLIYIPVLFLVPILWIIISTRMMSMSARSFFASILGLITPYWFAAAYCLYNANIDMLISHITAIANFTPVADFESLEIRDIAIFAIVMLLFITGSIHFIRTSHNDKIRTRMIYESFIIMTLALIVFAALQPSEIPQLVPIMSISVSPLIAHYITYTNTRLTNLSFVGIVVIVVLTLAYHIWTL